LQNLIFGTDKYQVRDRLSFTRFLRLGIEDSIPDATTVWLFREKLAKAFASLRLTEPWYHSRPYDPRPDYGLHCRIRSGHRFRPTLVNYVNATPPRRGMSRKVFRRAQR
jgi:hypothetical protein